MLKGPLITCASQPPISSHMAAASGLNISQVLLFLKLNLIINKNIFSTDQFLVSSENRYMFCWPAESLPHSSTQWGVAAWGSSVSRGWAGLTFPSVGDPAAREAERSSSRRETAMVGIPTGKE